MIPIEKYFSHHYNLTKEQRLLIMIDRMRYLCLEKLEEEVAEAMCEELTLLYNEFVNPEKPPQVKKDITGIFDEPIEGKNLEWASEFSDESSGY